ncbi:hypothetical protein [Shewanella fodinae]|jgi:hypothetical protein|uniref:Uncharacterized protein n=1 Tax=Shewanella fodinae TaxID=552357 RepID=A0A4V2RRH6_9GAMM|nr:hypothetical protein [Shewanella fodinae]TCN77706.1 hypothetical protein EDC91_1447 [Shewanella fodinae]
MSLIEQYTDLMKKVKEIENVPQFRADVKMKMAAEIANGGLVLTGQVIQTIEEQKLQIQALNEALEEGRQLLKEAGILKDEASES